MAASVPNKLEDLEEFVLPQNIEPYFVVSEVCLLLRIKRQRLMKAYPNLSRRFLSAVERKYIETKYGCLLSKGGYFLKKSDVVNIVNGKTDYLKDTGKNTEAAARDGEIRLLAFTVLEGESPLENTESVPFLAHTIVTFPKEPDEIYSLPKRLAIEAENRMIRDTINLYRNIPCLGLDKLDDDYFANLNGGYCTAERVVNVCNVDDDSADSLNSFTLQDSDVTYYMTEGNNYKCTGFTDSADFP